MKDELFAELIASVMEGGAILRGEKEAARTFHLDRLGIKRIRERYNLTQAQFAAMESACARCEIGSRAGASPKARRWCCCEWQINIQRQF